MGLISLAGARMGALLGWLKERREASAKARETTKRWVRPEPAVTEPGVQPAAEPPPAAQPDDFEVTTVESFAEIEQLIEQAGAAAPGMDPAGHPDEEAVADPAAVGDGEPPEAGVDNSPLLPPPAP
jgi:hypothetical protein